MALNNTIEKSKDKLKKIKLPVFNMQGEKVEDLTLASKIWGITPNEDVVHQVVVMQQANERQATSKVKNRSEVAGGGRKPWRQKGTGRARQGSIRSPQWRGGGVVFGPTTEVNYKKKVNKKVANLALRSALASKAQAKEVVILDQIKMEEISTKAMVAVLDALKISGQKTLIITDGKDNAITKSANNIEKTMVLENSKINVYDIINSNKLLLTKDTIKKIEEVLG